MTSCWKFLATIRTTLGRVSSRSENEEFRVVEGLLLADASGEIVRHPYVNNQLNKLLARWAFRGRDRRRLSSAGFCADG